MSRRASTVVAVDLGASTGRVVLADCLPQKVTLREVHRFPNTPVRAGGVLRWDAPSLFHEILEGMRCAADLAGTPDSVGVDGWGVDYGLLDANGRLLANPAHYRDPRTQPIVADVLDRIGAAELYAATGIALQPFNTLFQLLADRGTGQLEAAGLALLIPDLMNYWLSGTTGTELTNASTTALLDTRTRDWSADLANRLGVPLELFPPLRRPGHLAGRILPDVAAGAGIDPAPQVVHVPSHDTAAAVAGIPATSSRFAYVCTGTWALVGVELPGPVISEAARTAGFTNEVAADGSIRFLRNVTGFWLLQECVREWRASGSEVDPAKLTAAAADVPALRALIDVQDPRFSAPGDMPARIGQACLETSGIELSTPAEVTRCVLDSLSLAIRHAVHDAQELSAHAIEVVHVVGGGVASELFCQLVADACGRPVIAGPTEAASWGNVLCQARAIGVVDGSLTDTRAMISDTEELTAYQPRGDDHAWRRADQLVRAARDSAR